MQLFLLCGLLAFVSSSTPDWTHNVYLRSPLTLTCNDSRVMLQQSDVLTWKTPDGLVLSHPHNGSTYELKGDQGEQLFIRSVSLSTNGLYTCMISSGGTTRAYLLKGVNLSGPLFRSLNEKYEENVIVAVVSTAVFFVPLVGLCALQKFRYRSQDDKESKYILSSRPEKNGPPMGMINPGADFSTQL